VLETKELTCGYGAKPVLENINFRVESRDFLGIIGPNGSGKTTLLWAITKVLKPQSGEVLFEDKNIRQIGFKELAQKMAFVPQTSKAGLNVTVEDFVLLGRTPYFRRFQFLESRQDKEIANKAMALTGILGIKKRFIRELSGGERQLAIIASALAQEPKLLLLDEPTAHLDIAHQVGILDLIRRLNRKEGLTVMIVLHDLNLASEYCDRLILINNGRIHKIGSPKEVLTYQVIEEVYQATVIVKENPVSLKPCLFTVFEEEKQKVNARGD
jgi:iron complex transport system ATP-binding protein